MLKRDRYWLLLLLAALGVMLSLPVRAMELAEARQAGAVCEKPDGTLRAVSASPEARALVSEVNGKRAAEYARISMENGQTKDVVAKLAAVEIAKQPGVTACK